MTREEAVTILYKEWQRFSEDNLDYAGISDAYTMAINTLKQEPCSNCCIENSKWIPVNKQLPKESGKYLVTFGGTHLIGIDFYSTEEDAKKIFEEPEEDIGWRSHNVVAWLPLPLEPYKTESEVKEMTNQEKFIQIFGITAWQAMIVFSGLAEQFKEYWTSPYRTDKESEEVNIDEFKQAAIKLGFKTTIETLEDFMSALAKCDNPDEARILRAGIKARIDKITFHMMKEAELKDKAESEDE